MVEHRPHKANVAGSIPAAGTMKIVHRQAQHDPERRRRVAILGFGREGKSLLKFLKKSPQFKNADISILDQKFNRNYLKNLDKSDVIFRSPGVPYNLPEIQKAIKKGVKFSSASQLFFDEIGKMVRRGSPRVIGITGTKGKGTTATLLYKILEACGKKALLAGNIGKPALDILPHLKKKFIVILELSSFQLQDLKISPEIAVVLDTFPDHMDAHKSLKEYFGAKINIAKWQKKSDKIFYFGDNHRSKWIAQKSRAKKFPIRIHSGRSDKFVISDRDLKMPGAHNFKNAVMAASVALSLGCPKEKVLKVIKNFRGNEHRLELVRTIKIPTKRYSNILKNIGISFYNDSASTNPQTAAAAIRAFKEPSILIAGGKDKGLNYSPLAKALKNSNTKLVILFGQNKNKIKKQVVSSKCQVKLVKDLKSAINLAYKTAKQLQQLEHYNNITIIFSPGSASFDMFKDYVDRGEKFKELVRKLTQ